MKPRLFLDVDGVILATYNLPGQGGVFQMRPHVGSFINWAHQHFDLYWLTCHGADSTKKICHYNNVVQFDSLKEKLAAPVGIKGITYAKWQDFTLSEESLNLDKIQGVINHGGLTGEWLVIEDQFPCYDAYNLIHSQPELKNRWIIVPDTGCELFLPLQNMLKEYLQTGRINPPWVQPPVDPVGQRQGLTTNFPKEIINGLKKSN